MNSPKIAIVDSNTLAAVGLRQMLQDVFPAMEVDIFASYDDLVSSEPEKYFHYFVVQDTLAEHYDFFFSHLHKTIMMTSRHKSDDKDGVPFKQLCVSVPEKQLVRSILQLVIMGHAGGRNLPSMTKLQGKSRTLTEREIEVLSLIAQGLINKEIANRLNISLTTVISHRKNITEKLGIKRVSALTIYAVMHGYISIENI